MAKILTNNKMNINIDCEEVNVVPFGIQKITLQITAADIAKILDQIGLEKVFEHFNIIAYKK